MRNSFNVMTKLPSLTLPTFLPGLLGTSSGICDRLGFFPVIGAAPKSEVRLDEVCSLLPVALSAPLLVVGDNTPASFVG